MQYHIAVFDDSPRLAYLFQVILTIKGFTVSLLPQDASGLQAVKRLAPDLIILGNLREPSDLPFLDGLRVQPETQACPVIIATTGACFFADRHIIAQYPQVYLLAKPFSMSVLLASVAQALGPTVGQFNVASRALLVTPRVSFTSTLTSIPTRRRSRLS